MEDTICPNCGKVIEVKERHYLFCYHDRDDGSGCNTIWGRSLDCYFTQLYIVDESGGIIAYKQSEDEGGKVIYTDRMLPEYPPRGLPGMPRIDVNKIEAKAGELAV